MLASEFLQRNGEWRFDFLSALIGALAAWLIAGLIYRYREQLQDLLQRLWAPIVTWRRRIQASQEEKYLRALRPKLSSLLFLNPQDPPQVFCPPQVEVLPPLPSTIREAREGQSVRQVPFDRLMEGHPHVVLTGPQDSGRTTLMANLAWDAWGDAAGGPESDAVRLPIWIDLARFSELEPDPDAEPTEKLAELAALFLPKLMPRWILKTLKATPALILMDHWNALKPEDRSEVAAWIQAASEAWEDTVWFVAAGKTGYGALTEIGFTPATLFTRPDELCALKIADGWQELHAESAEAAPETELDIEPLHESLVAAVEADAPLWELHLRAALFFELGETAGRLIEALERWVDERLPTPTLGDEEQDRDAAKLARTLAREILVEAAQRERLEGERWETRTLRAKIEDHLPPEEDEQGETRHPKLESAIRRLLIDTPVYQPGADKTWAFSHPIWTEYFTAQHLVDAEDGYDRVREHLFAPPWSRIVSFYIALTEEPANASDLVNALLRTGEGSGLSRLLRAARWAAIAPPEAEWRRTLMRALARSYVGETTSPHDRERAGRALVQVAGEKGARAFFVKTLRQPSLDIRLTSIRGLGWSGYPEDMKILAAALRDESAEVREAAVLAIRDMGTAGAVTFLGESLSRADEETMFLMAEALADLPDGPQVLIDATDHPDLLVRRAAAHGLGQIDQTWARERLAEMIREDPEWLVRSAAEAELEAMEKQTGRRPTIPGPPQVDEIDWLIAWAAEQGQGLGVGDAAIPTLVQAAQEGRDDVKILSALTLTKVGDETHIPVLESMAAEASAPAVQAAAASALDELRRRYPSDLEPEAGEG